MMIIEELADSEHAAWDAYVEAHPAGNCYHLRAWRDVAQKAYRLRAPWLVARDPRGGALRGALPLFVCGTPLNRYVTSGLFGAYGRVLADDPEAGRALVDEARRITARAGGRYLILKSLGEEPLATGFEQRDQCVPEGRILARSA